MGLRPVHLLCCLAAAVSPSSTQPTQSARITIAHTDATLAVSIDACDVPAFADWTHGADARLRMRDASGVEGSAAAYRAGRAHNFYAIGAVSAPAGVRVEICEPDFSRYPETAQCSDDTVISTACGANCTVSAPSLRYQMLRLAFLADYGCWDTAAAGERLIGSSNPTRKEACTLPPNATHWHPDQHCHAVCDTGYEAVHQADEARCVAKCGALETACPDDWGATQTCTAMDPHRYACVPCVPAPGHDFTPFAERTNKTCAGAVRACPPGTHSPAGLACLPCQRNTVPDAAAARCDECRIGDEAAAGSASCAPCALVPGICARGSRPAANRSHALQHLEATPLTQGQREAAMRGWCDAGAACLTCPPGTHSPGGAACEPCPRGRYQPHWGAAACFPCAAGQSTLQEGAAAGADCRCTPGFE